MAADRDLLVLMVSQGIRILIGSLKQAKSVPYLAPWEGAESPSRIIKFPW